MKIFLGFSFFWMLISGCGNGSERIVNREEVKEAIESRKLIRVTEAEIIKSTYTVGKTIATSAHQGLAEKLRRILSKSDTVSAATLCNLKDIEALDSLLSVYKAAIKRISPLKANTQTRYTEVEFELLDAYLYQTENKAALSSNVQLLKNNNILYTSPIFLDDKVCLQCHGQPNVDISPKIDTILKETYPNDHIFPYKQGSLLGIYSIEIPRKSVIKSFQD